jgi:hypothetical protein
VFVSFLVGLLAMPRLARRKCPHKSIVINPIAAIVVAFTQISAAGSRAASPALAQPNTTIRRRSLASPWWAATVAADPLA